MKTTAFFALSTLATAAMAVQPTSPGTISIGAGGSSTQNTYISDAVVSNLAGASGTNTRAYQNLASNHGGNVVINGASAQSVNATGPGTTIMNESAGSNSYALQKIGRAHV